MKLNNWSVVTKDPFLAPEIAPAHLQGEVFGHPRFEDGRIIVTSSIASVSREEGTITTKSGGVYTLGEIDPEYEAIYPNSRERLFNESF